jgi:hypothetical protein
MTEVALRLKSMLASGPSSGTVTAGAGEGKYYLPVWGGVALCFAVRSTVYAVVYSVVKTHMIWYLRMCLR